MSGDVIKTEVILSEESIERILAAETAKALLNVPEFMSEMVRQVLFQRPAKRSSYEKDKPTLFESAIMGALKPMIAEEVEKLAEGYRPKLRKILSKAFKTHVADNGEFETRILDRLASFTSNISFYVKE